MQKAHRPRMSSLAAALAGGLLLGLLLAGCADDGGPDPTPTEAAPAPTPTAQGSSALPLERFHYVASLTLREKKGGSEASEIVVSTEGDFQSPDRHAFTYTTQLGDGTIEQSAVIIGDQAWLRLGDDPWRQTTPDDPRLADLLTVAFSAVQPRFLGGPQLQNVRESVRRLPSTEESVNGVPANHYRVGPAGKEYFEAFVAGEQFLRNVRDLSWDLWLAAEGGWPVRLLASGTIAADLTVLDRLDLQAPTSWELRIDISRPNDPTLTVVAPEEGS